MNTFAERKQERKAHYEKYVKGWKERPCSSCNGSCYYDHNGSPECGGCDGTGKEIYKPESKRDEKACKNGRKSTG